MADITIYQGNDVDLPITVRDPAGVAQDITGFSATFIIARHVDDTPAVSKATGGGGIALTDPANGVLTVSLSDTDTDLRGDYYYQCDVQDGAGNDSTVSTGTITFEATA